MTNEFQAVVAELGGRQAPGRELTTDHDLREAIRQGFPPAVVDLVMRASGLTLKRARKCARPPGAGFTAPPQRQTCSYESDRLYRLARIMALAKESLVPRARHSLA